MFNMNGITSTQNYYRALNTIKSKNGTLASSFLEQLQSGAKSLDANTREHHVYLKTDDMLYSGGNGTGLSFYIKYSENSTKDNPIIIAKGVDEHGNGFEKTIQIKDVDPFNATIVEMRALEACLDADKGGGLSSFPLSAGDMGFSERRNFMALFSNAINEQALLGQSSRARFYSSNMQMYSNFIKL